MFNQFYSVNKHLLNGLSADYSLCVTFRLVNYHLSMMVACLFVVGCGYAAIAALLSVAQSSTRIP